jgi:hypothetical protein
LGLEERPASQDFRLEAKTGLKRSAPQAKRSSSFPGGEAVFKCKDLK